MGTINRIAKSQWTAGAILALGFALRLLWLYMQPDRPPDYGEAGNIAYALSTTGQFADSFRAGQGPTAHLMPIAPVIAAGAYHLFGFGNTAEWVLSVYAACLVLAGFWLQFRTFEMLGLPRLPALATLAALCLIPLNFALEVVWFRVWEGALAVALASLVLYFLVEWDQKAITRWRLLGLGALLGFLFFVQPPLGLGCITAAVIFGFRNLRLQQSAEAAGVCVLTACLLMVPWAIRNDRALGEPVLLRSNFGLEIALAFHDQALAPDKFAALKKRTLDIHPYSSNGSGYAKMQKTGGEIAYFEKLELQARNWISEHPAKAVQLIVLHVTEMLFPNRWQFEGATHPAEKMLIHWLISALGIMGVASATLSHDRRQLYPAVILAITLLPYLLVTPNLRYRYLLFAMLAFFAARCVTVILQLVWRKRRKAGDFFAGDFDRSGD